MNAWLQPSVVSTLLSGCIMAIAYGYVYIQEKKTYLKYFAIAWFVYISRFVFVLVKLSGCNNLLIENFIYIAALINAIVLLYGVRSFIGNEKIKWILPAGILVVLSVFVFDLFGIIPFFKVFYVFYFSGTIYILTGIVFIRNFHLKSRLSQVIGFLFILWGLHKYDYPFLANVQSVAYIGYLLSSCLELSVAVSLLLFYYKLSRLALQKDEDRFENLLQLSTLEHLSEEILLDRALHMAIEITESRIGYIYYYDEETEIFTLNSWSKSAMQDCQMENKNKVYSLESTGCWGEAVRQRQPVLINKYSKDHELSQGIPAGHVRLRNFLTVPIFHEGKIVAVIGVANKKSDYDNGDIRQLQFFMDGVWKIKLQYEQNRELKLTKEAAEESNRIKTVFLANISHELRTPLNGILGMAALLEFEGLNETQRQYLGNIKTSGYNLLGIIEDLLEVSYVKDRKIVFTPENFNLKTLVETIIEERVQRINDDASLKIEFEYDYAFQNVHADKYRLGQVIAKVLDNSIKFTESGTVSVRISGDSICLIEINDTGSGIEQEELGQIFDTFYSADDPYQKTHRGLGLGLSIVKAIIEQNNGTISIKSVRGKGTSVRIEMPLVENSDIHRNGSETNLKKIGQKIHKILVAEDDMINKMYIVSLLEKNGFEYMEAENGREVLQLAGNNFFDLILMDIGMPEMDGLQAAAELKKNSRTKDIPIIAVTAYADIQDQEKIRKAGLDYVAKPFTELLLITKLQQILKIL